MCEAVESVTTVKVPLADALVAQIWQALPLTRRVAGHGVTLAQSGYCARAIAPSVLRYGHGVN